MTYSFIAILALLIGGIFICYKESKKEVADSFSSNMLMWLLGVLATLAGLIGCVMTAFLALQYTGAQHKADIINREYGTSYTQAEVFYASDVINIVRELDRKRYEINGDFRRQRDPQRNLRPEEK